MKTAVQFILTALLFLLALPKAVGLTLLMYLEALPAGQFGEGPPTDLKALHEATEKAFKAMEENIKKSQDTAMKALEEVRAEGTLHTKTNEALTALGKTGNELSESVKELRTRILEVEQKQTKNPRTEISEEKSIGQMVIESEQYKAAQAGAHGRNMSPVTVGSFHKTNVVNATGASQPLVPADRLGTIIMPFNRRMTIRQLLPNNRTTSNMIEFPKELLFTSNAGAQGGSSPIGNGEGELKPESALTFELASTPVCGITHFIPASRQILSDAPMLQGYIDGRLRYGLMLKEEDELLNGDGGAGTLQGLVNQATAFTGGSTNQTYLDTLLKAFLQISLQNMEATGVIMHPTDWTNIMLEKDTTGRYLFSDPHSTESPRVWGKDVVPTASQTLGQFLAGAFILAAEIFDREDANVMIAEQHSDFFVRNLVAIRAEERLALAVYRALAIVKGSISNAG